MFNTSCFAAPSVGQNGNYVWPYHQGQLLQEPRPVAVQELLDRQQGSEAPAPDLGLQRAQPPDVVSRHGPEPDAATTRTASRPTPTSGRSTRTTSSAGASCSSRCGSPSRNHSRPSLSRRASPPGGARRLSFAARPRRPNPAGRPWQYDAVRTSPWPCARSWFSPLLLPVLAAGSPPRPGRAGVAGREARRAAPRPPSRSRRSPGGPRPPGTAATPRRRSAGTARGCAFVPSWDEGWWYLGALSYEQGLGAQAAAGLRPLRRAQARLRPRLGAAGPVGVPGEGLRRARCATSRAASRSGPSATPRSATPSTTTWRSCASGPAQFELAVEPLSALARAKAETPDLVDRVRALPAAHAAPARGRPGGAARARAGGGAGRLRRARPQGRTRAQRFEELLARYPDDAQPALRVRRLPPAAGRGARGRGARRSSEKEIEVNPSRGLRAASRSRSSSSSGASTRRRCPTRRAPCGSPRASSPAHHALGRALVETGAVPRGVARAGGGGAARAREPRDAGGARPGLRAWRAAARTPSASARTYKRLQVERETKRLPGFAREDTIGQEAKKP